MLGEQPKQFAVLGAGDPSIRMIDFIGFADYLPLGRRRWATVMMEVKELDEKDEQGFLDHGEGENTFCEGSDPWLRGHMYASDELVRSSIFAERLALFITACMTEFSHQPFYQGHVCVADMNLRDHPIRTRYCCARPSATLANGKTDRTFAIHDASDVGSLNIREMVIQSEVSPQAKFLYPPINGLWTEAQLASNRPCSLHRIHGLDIGNLIVSHPVSPVRVSASQSELACSVSDGHIAETQDTTSMVSTMPRKQDFELFDVFYGHYSLSIHNREC